MLKEPVATQRPKAEPVRTERVTTESTAPKAPPVQRIKLQIVPLAR